MKLPYLLFILICLSALPARAVEYAGIKGAFDLVCDQENHCAGPYYKVADGLAPGAYVLNWSGYFSPHIKDGAQLEFFMSGEPYLSPINGDAGKVELKIGKAGALWVRLVSSHMYSPVKMALSISLYHEMSSSAHDMSRQQVGVVKAINGVGLINRGQGVIDPMQGRGQPVYFGDRIEIDSGGEAEIEIYGGAVIRIHDGRGLDINKDVVTKARQDPFAIMTMGQAGTSFDE
jgi:hypothetical protein